MLDKYWTLLRMKWVEMFEYRAETVIWVLGAITQPAIALAIWLGIAGQEPIAGFGQEQLILYFAALIFVERMTTAWDVWELDREIREGTLSFRLVRPLHPVHWAIAENMVYKVVFLIILLPMWWIASLFVPVLRLDWTIGQWAAFTMSLVLGLVIRFLIGWCIGLLGFWFNRVIALYGILEGISLFFSGRIAPLEFLPPFMGTIGQYLPFSSIIYFPVKVLMGTLSVEQLWLGFLGQVIWVVILLVVFRLLWRAGLRAYQAVGG